IDLSDIHDTEREIITTQTVNHLHQSLNITQGPTLQVALLDFGPDRGSKLFVTAHHLVTDASSFLILLEDLQTAYTQLSRSQNIQLPAKTTSIKTFSECWYAYAQSAAVRQEAEYWLNLPWNYTPFPIDYPNASAADNVEGSIDIVQVSLGQEETNVLLHKMPSVYHAQMLDVLLMALVQSITSRTGGTWLPVIMLDSGRIPLFDMDDMDLSRSVGLFAAGSFMILQQPDTGDPIKKVMSIREQVRQVPNRGVGFELLLRCSEDAGLRKQLQKLRKGDVKFNYLGRINAPPDLESTEIFTCPQMKRDETLYGQAFIIKDRLYVNWWYSKHLHRRETIEGIGQQFIFALQSLVDHIAGVSRREYLKGN
ncbi:MAG: hypothetical protein KC421_21410, partial [Anaerolineales bacterium]|nr:hypothetical protein [Anaerolineales bacterium]